MGNKGDEGLIDGQHFYSKRNQVTYEESKDCVRKKYFDPRAYDKETWVYRKLDLNASVRVPEVLGQDQGSLVLELSFVHGPLLLDQLIICELEGDSLGAIELFVKLYRWMDSFYEAMGSSYILQDVNLRNFIVREQQIYGIDFEMVVEGDRFKEKCMVLAMYLMYDPAQTSFKKKVLERVIEDNFERLRPTESEINKCIKTIEKRRSGKE